MQLGATLMGDISWLQRRRSVGAWYADLSLKDNVWPASCEVRMYWMSTRHSARMLG